jgi:hypothetical protein
MISFSLQTLYDTSRHELFDPPIRTVVVTGDHLLNEVDSWDEEIRPKDYENYLGEQNYLKRIGSDTATNVKSCTSTEFREFKSRFYDEIPEAGYRSTYGDQKLLLEAGTYPEKRFRLFTT